MFTQGEDFRTIWLDADDPSVVRIIDQRRLPHRRETDSLRDVDDGIEAIRDMRVRGAPLIGATAAWSLYLAAAGAPPGRRRQSVDDAAPRLVAARPTAVNLRWAVERMRACAARAEDDEIVAALRTEAARICDEDVEICRRIGLNGLKLIEGLAARKAGEPVNILTHCNAGALATINYGTATAPIYLAHRRGIPVHVWVDETRPRNQGSQLTAWELAENGIEHTLIVDNAGGHLMQHGRVDLCLVGTDRTTRCGDVANKIGTYLKALAAKDNGVPFYVALPSTTIDWETCDGIREIPIEEREPGEVTQITGALGDEIVTVDTLGSRTAVSNYAFDVTPGRLITGLITEAGVCPATEAGLAGLFPAMARKAS